MSLQNGERESRFSAPVTRYWNVNVPDDQQTMECPEFLADVDDYDKAQLGTRDEDYNLMTWQEVQNIINTNRLETFKRIPSELRRYRQYIADIKQSYGSVLNFILKERVQWDEVIAKGEPFQEPDDIRILRNDWPYGIDPKIVHLVVWTKFAFEEDQQTGDLTPKAKKTIDRYVESTFRQHVPRECVCWFKNWSALKSVHAVEHFHVMLYDPPADFVQRLTGDDIAMAERADKIHL